MRRSAGSLALTLMWSGCTCSSDVTIAPPRVPQGGRAVAIAVAFSDAKRIIVGTESGGLFRTFDGGVSFQHLDRFPTFAPLGVAIASTNPNIVIATARDDFRTISGGGIWRSTDGGASWKRPAGWPPAGCDRAEARSISHMPLTRTFYVATDCGIAVSADDGASFSMVVLDPGRPKVRDVLVVNRSRGVAVDNMRMWFLNSGTWQAASGGPSTGSEYAINGLASPWWTGQPVFYHAARDFEVYISTDAGATWDIMPTLPHGGGREHVIRVGRGLDGDPTHFDVYFADGFALWRQAVTTAVPQGTNAWKQLQSDHRDPADVAFTPGFEKPLMLATDGGVHLTTDNGKNWKLTGSGYGGFTALQIGEMTGRAVTGSNPHLDLYYGTQDNDLKASSDGGHTWDGSIGSEGAFINADAANPAHVDGPVTGRHDARLFQASDHFGVTQSPPAFKSAPNGSSNPAAAPPVQLVGATYLQSVMTTIDTAVSFDFHLTKDRGSSWTPVFSLADAPIGVAKFSGSLDNPVAYIGVKRPSSRIGLVRVQDVATQPVVRSADSIGLGSIGLLRTFQATYTVFAVDPANANHLLAADVSAKEMMASADGGTRWFALPALTAAVTDTAKFMFAKDIVSFATVIAWDPTNSCHILVGTLQNGVIRSSDGGMTWKRVAGSEVVTYVSSFFFPPTGQIWMSSYGRGLWTLSVDRKRSAGSRCEFPSPPGTVPPITLPVDDVSILLVNSDRSAPSSLVRPGDSVAIYGSGFRPGNGARGVDIVVGMDTVMTGTEVRKDGTFFVQLPVKRGPGILDITAIQRTEKGMMKDRNSITVIGTERH